MEGLPSEIATPSHQGPTLQLMLGAPETMAHRLVVESVLQEQADVFDEIDDAGLPVGEGSAKDGFAARQG